MVYPTVTELTRGTAHPRSQSSETVVVELPVGDGSSVANTSRITDTGAWYGDFRERATVPSRLAA
jgi:hypothetical protein